MPFFATDDGVKLFYDDRGSGRPVILIHGLTANHSHFRKQIPVLGRHFRVIAPDLRGHGDSDRPRDGLTISRLALDLRGLIIHLGLDAVTLVGWSMGGHVIFEYIRQFGCRDLEGMAVVDMAPKLMKADDWSLGLRGISGRFGDFSHHDNLLLMSRMCAGWEDYCTLLIPRLFNRSDVDGGINIFEEPGFFWKDDLGWLLEAARRNSPHVIVFLWISLMLQDYRPELAAITVPCLLVWGRESNYYGQETYAFMEKALVNAPALWSVPFEGCGHALHIQNPDRFNGVLMDFMERPVRAAPSCAGDRAR